MKKLLAVLVLLASAVAAVNVTMYRFRATANFTGSTTFTHTRIASPARVSSITVGYSEPFTGSLYVITVQDNVTALRTVVELGTATSVVVVPEGLWMKPQDLLIISNNVGVAAAVSVDYVE